MIGTPKIATGQSSQPMTVVAPVGGLNGRDPLASMAPSDAYQMDNAFPGAALVYSRKGSKRYTSSKLPAPVQSLEVYTGATGDKMLGWSGGSIYDVSSNIPVQLATGLNSNLVITAMFSNAADNAQHLIITSGKDTPREYNGVSLTVLAFTGIADPTLLNFCFTFKARLYFGAEDKLGFYYLPVGQIQGALSYFDLGQVSRLGGKLVAIASYSSDSGITPGDYIVFITSKGECIVYAGYDPSNANTWELVGRYYAATPIGQKCTLNYGTELVLLTLDGAIGFSEIRRAGDARTRGVPNAEYSAITSKLGTYLSAFNTNADVPGWMGLQYSGSQDGWLLINVPAGLGMNGAYYQYVMNTTTNAWCRFTNWNALCFAVFGGKLFFGKYDGLVYQGDVGNTDDGTDINLSVKQAYNYFEDGNGIGFLTKHFQWASLLVGSDGPAPLSGKFNVDYREYSPDPIAAIAVAGSRWDITKWDEGYWSDEENTQRFIVTLNNAGVAGSLWIAAKLSGQTFKWYATQYVMQKTKGLLP